MCSHDQNAVHCCSCDKVEGQRFAYPLCFERFLKLGLWKKGVAGKLRRGTICFWRSPTVRWPTDPTTTAMITPRQLLGWQFSDCSLLFPCSKKWWNFSKKQDINVNSWLYHGSYGYWRNSCYSSTLLAMSANFSYVTAPVGKALLTSGKVSPKKGWRKMLSANLKILQRRRSSTSCIKVI